MDPVVFGFLIFAAIAGVGYFFERWSWSRAAAVAGGIALIASSVLSACSHEDKPTQRVNSVARTRLPDEKWIVVGVEKRISATEDIRILRIASSVAPQVRALDRSCLLYRNDELKVSQVVCPDGVPDLSFYGD